MSNEGKKNWERPWTTEEIVEQADNWNLACDAALLHTLKTFGNKVLNKSEEVHKKVDSLCNNLDQTSLQVDLVRNEFNSLRNGQFVECRVYEEDETLLTKQEEEEKAENDVPKEETMEDLKKAVELGLEILDKYYDKVEVTVSDSEDDDVEVPSYVYRRKDPYLHRPLPYVIGSEEWYKKWHVGLQESSDSENEKSASDKFSDSENEDNFEIKDHSDVSSEFSNVSVSNTSKDRPVAVSTANTTLQNDFLAPTSGSNSPATPTPKVLSFAEQLAAKLGNVIKENEGLMEEPQVNRRPIQKKPSDYGALFSDEPPPLDERAIKEPESHGIFSGGKGLFDGEEDDDDDLWNPVKSNISSGPLGFNKSGNTAARTVQSKGLFDEDSDDDIFAPAQKPDIKNQIKQSYLQTPKPDVPVFHEEPPLLKEEKKINEKKKPVGGISVFGKSEIFKNRGDVLKQRKKSSSGESNEDKPPPKISEITQELNANTVSNQEGSFRSLRSENIDSNKQIISNVPKVTETPEGKRPHQKKNNLFEDNEPTIFEDAKPQTKKSSLFDDIFGDDLFSDTNKKFSSNLFSEDDLFSEGETTKPSQPNEKSTTEGSHIVTKKQISLSKDKLFDDIEQQADIKNEYDYSWRNSSKKQIGSLFDDIDDDFDTFVQKKSDISDEQNNNKKKVHKPEDIKHKKPTVNLFDDEFDDVDDLFTKIMKIDTKKIKPSLKDPPNELFHQESRKEELDTLKRVEKAQFFSSKNPEAQPESTTVQKENPSSYNSVDEKSDEPKLITETLADESFDKILENSSKNKEEGFDSKEYLKSGKIQRLDNISREQTLPTDKVHEFDDTTSNLKVKMEYDTNISSSRSRNSMNIPHVNFLDSVPPPDDGWDNSSDNIFDDVEHYGNDGFQSQPSSLFDNEPPSLFFNDTSGIVRDDVENRIDSVNSFDPSLTSSRRLSSDIFSDTQNDSFLITKNQDGTSKASRPSLQSVPEMSDFLSEENTDITPSGNPDDLYNSISVNVTEKGSSVEGSVKQSSAQKISDQLTPSTFKTSSDESYVGENKFDLKPSADMSDQKRTEKNMENYIPPISPNTEQEGVTLLDTDSTSVFLNKTEKSIAENIYIKQDVNNESLVKPHPIEKKVVSLFDDLFDKNETDDVFSESKVSINKPKISVKPSLGKTTTKDEKYSEDTSEKFNPLDNYVNAETGGAVLFETVKKAKVLNTSVENVHTEKHTAKSVMDPSEAGVKPVSLFEDIFGEEISEDSSNDKPKITSDSSSIKTSLSQKRSEYKSDLFKSLENYMHIEPDDADLFGTTDESPFVKKKPEAEKISTVELGHDSLIDPIENEKKPIAVFDYISDNENEVKHSIMSKTKQDSGINDFINREFVISDNGSIEKCVSFDKNTVANENDLRDESLHQEESDEMQSNIAKIAERLQQLSNKPDEKPKVTVVPGKLSHKLNINVGALLPGSAPPRKDKVQSPDVKTPEDTKEEPDLLKKPIPILRTQSETHSVEREYKLEKSVSFDNAADVEVLQSITKNRPKIPVKRRPSSRKARQQPLKDSVPDIKVTDDSVSGEKCEENNAKDPSASLQTKKSSESYDNVIKSITEISRQNEHIKSEESSTIENREQLSKSEKEIKEKSDGLKVHLESDMKKKMSLFDDEGDETEDFFKTIQKDMKNVNRAKIVNTKKEDIFDESDLFGKTLKENQEHPVPSRSTSHKLVNKKTEIDTLFDSSDESDELTKSNKKISDSSTNEETVAGKNKPSISIIGQIVEKASSSKSYKETKTLFDSSDEDDDFLKSLATIKKEEKSSSKTIPHVNIGKKLFDDEIGDEDIFGISSSLKTTRQETLPSVINKKTSRLRKLENVEGDEDPLSAMLK